MVSPTDRTPAMDRIQQVQGLLSYGTSTSSTPDARADGTGLQRTCLASATFTSP